MLEFFCRHLVSLCVTYEHQNATSSPRGAVAAYAGTILCIRGMACFLTAGHIVRQLQKVIQASDLITIHSAVLADTFGWKRVSDHPIPLDLVHAPRFFIDDDDEGLDFGLIALNSITCVCLKPMVLCQYSRTIGSTRQKWHMMPILCLECPKTSHQSFCHNRVWRL